MKLPEFISYIDGLTFIVAESVNNTTILAGDFTVTATAALTDWPDSGHFCINACVYTYGSIVSNEFRGCYATTTGTSGFGDNTPDVITIMEIGEQAVPASIVNELIDRARAFMVYLASDAPTGITITVAPGELFDGTVRVSYAGENIALNDDATNYIYLWNDSGTATIDVDTTSWFHAAGVAGSTILYLAEVVVADGIIESILDCRNALRIW